MCSRTSSISRGCGFCNTAVSSPRTSPRSSISVEGAIEDDGTGMPDAVGEGTGLRSMAQRIAAVGGDFDIGRSSYGGTLVRFRVPVEVER